MALPTPADVSITLRRATPWAARLAHGCGPRRDPFLYAALCARETGFGQVPGYRPRGNPIGFGDRGNGFGFFQQDRGVYRDAIRSGKLDTFEAQLEAAITEVEANWLNLRTWVPGLAGDALDRAAVAAYNAWVGSVAYAILGGSDPDSVTTGKDYSAWVFAMRDGLRRASPGLFGAPR